MDHSVAILIVEDSESDAELLVHLLDKADWDLTFERVDDAEQMREALGRRPWDMVISDYSLPRFDAPSALHVLRETGLDIPFIVVSGSIGEEIAVAMMKAGADDYLMKDNLSRLIPAIERELERSKQRLASKRAEAERARLAMAIDHIAEGVVVTNTGGVIEYANPAFEHITGYHREEILGQNVRIFKSGEQDEAFYRALWKTITEGKVWSGHFLNRRKDGSLYNEECTISPVFDQDGGVVSYVAIKRDISAQLMLERQLRQSQKLEAIGTLAGGIAHDFNNILSSIIGYSEMAKEDLDAGRSVENQLDVVLAAAQRAKELVQQILVFSHQAEEERGPLELGLIVKEVLKLLRPSLPATIEIDTQIGSEGALVMADPSQMHQVLMNLCTNAYQAMRESGGILSVSVESEELDCDAAYAYPKLEKGPYVVLSVSDTGSGIEEAIQDRIFEPFFTTKSPGEGTGLGLATVHGIVRSHGGVITMASEVGRGTTFQVYLPRIAENPDGALPSDEPVRGGNERILVVDDEHPLARLLAATLREYGYQVTVMTRSADALAAFTERPEQFDLILTDQTMPGMTGEKLIEAVKQIRQDIPVILTTGFVADPFRKRLAELGVDAVLPKPSHRWELVKVVRGVLDAALSN